MLVALPVPLSPKHLGFRPYCNSARKAWQVSRSLWNTLRYTEHAGIRFKQKMNSHPILSWQPNHPGLAHRKNSIQILKVCEAFQSPARYILKWMYHGPGFCNLAVTSSLLAQYHCIIEWRQWRFEFGQDCFPMARFQTENLTLLHWEGEKKVQELLLKQPLTIHELWFSCVAKCLCWWKWKWWASGN